MPKLSWLPEVAGWRTRLVKLPENAPCAWNEVVALAGAPLDYSRTNALDSIARRILADNIPEQLNAPPVRLAILSSCTTAHLHAGIRVGGMRRSLWIDIYEAAFGQYLQELADHESPLHVFRPNVILFTLDGRHLAAGLTSALDTSDVQAELAQAKDRLRSLWRLAREAFHCPIIQQTPLPVHELLLGNNEHRLAGSRAAFITRLNHDLRPMADAEGVELLSIDSRAALDGLRHWHDPTIWHHAKQEIAPTAAPMYGDLVARIAAAKLGRSFKCLVLDLDNTIWGGVVGDDGVEGLVLGQGSALGEAYVAFQDYLRELSRRGVILAVCSKNDEANALEAFERHPDMLLSRKDIAMFVANWSDKANNIRTIAAELNIGLDSIVFVDDNPFERNLVRKELPMVAVPELSEDVAYYPQMISDAGYFETLSVTQGDRERTSQYIGNRARENLKQSVTDLASYLRGLEMKMHWKPFDRVGLQRIVQLINKSNQFNLTTRRYTEEDVLAVVRSAGAFGLQLRLLDKFGDNGTIGIVIGRMVGFDAILIDTWLMSCRVLGRQVEQATLDLLVREARRRGARHLIGEYIPTKKNGMVAGHYERLGFTLAELNADGGHRATLDLTAYQPALTSIQLIEADNNDRS